VLRVIHRILTLRLLLVLRVELKRGGTALKQTQILPLTPSAIV
jgi:hypothetical protein